MTEIFIIVLTKLNLEYGGSYGDRPAIVLTKPNLKYGGSYGDHPAIVLTKSNLKYRSKNSTREISMLEPETHRNRDFWNI